MRSFRQKEIIDILERERVINTAATAQQFGVSIETIRRDLDQLEKQGILRKTYGGAELCSKTPVLPAPLESRRAAEHSAKVALALRAAEYVPDNCTVTLDAGSTVQELCRYLREKSGLIVMTVDIHSAAELLYQGSGQNKVYMIGGFLTPDGTASGTYAKEFLNSISGVDIFLTSTDGASPEEGLSTDETYINELKRRYIKKAKKRIAMVDHSKFMRKGFYRMCDFSDIDVVITDSQTPPEIIEKLRRMGTVVDVVSVPGT